MPDPIPTLGTIEALTGTYAARLEALQAVMQEIDDEIQLAKRRRLSQLRRRAAEAADARAALARAIQAAPDLFLKPRTRVLHGIKVGLQKGKDALVWEDDAKVCALIRKYYQDDLGVLIKTTEKPLKEGLERLPAAELQRLGVEQVRAGDQIVIKSALDEIEKIVNALLADDIDELAEAG